MPTLNWSIWARKLHRWATLLVVLPFFIVLVSGLLLQVKKQFDWIQPPTQSGTAPGLALSFEEILDAARTAEAAGIRSWKDVDRLDVRPDKGVVKVRSTNRWEVQIDTNTGAVLHVAERRSDVIEAIHDGSWFHDSATLWVFLPSAILVLGLWITGVYLFWLPYSVRRAKPLVPDRVEANGVKPAHLPDLDKRESQPSEP
jgi:uncharacterized iron-regulated membrane protein